MKAERQVCTLSQSKKLYQLGVRGGAAFWWRNDYPSNSDKYPDVWYLIYDDDFPYRGQHVTYKYDDGFHLIPAFTASEIMVMLPTCDCSDRHRISENSGMNSVHFHPNCFRTRFKESKKKWVIGDGYPLASGHAKSIHHAATETQAKAKLLIWLLTTKRITAEEVNERYKPKNQLNLIQL